MRDAASNRCWRARWMKRALVVFGLALAFLTSGCGLPPLVEEEKRDAALYGGVLTVRVQRLPGIVNPLLDDEANRKVALLAFSGLMRLDNQLRPVNDLAEDWSTSPDELTWTFKLHADARWHDGTPVTADDVIFTYESLLKSKADTALKASLQSAIKRLDKVDDYQVSFLLRRRHAPLLADLATPVLPRHLLLDVSPDRISEVPLTVGTGPFRLVGEQQGALVFEAYDAFHRGRPYLDRVALVASSDQNTAVAALERGELLVGEVQAEAATRLTGQMGLEVKRWPEAGFYFVGFNLRPPRPLSDRAVRQAWALAVDKEALVEQVTQGSGIPVWSDAPIGTWAYDESLPHPTPNLEEARRVLEGAGWRDSDGDGVREKGGRPLAIELLVRNDAPVRVAAAHMLAETLVKVGMKVEVVPADFETTLAAKRRPPFDFDALLMGWTLGNDPDNYYLFHSSQIPTAENPAGYNFVGFNNPDFDRLCVEARSSVDYQKRADLYRQMQQILAEEQPYYFLWADAKWAGVSTRLVGPSPTFSDGYLWNVGQWHFEPPEAKKEGLEYILDWLLQSLRQVSRGLFRVGWSRPIHHWSVVPEE